MQENVQPGNANKFEYLLVYGQIIHKLKDTIVL